VAVAAFLRVINALENIRQSIELLEASLEVSFEERGRLLARAVHETDDSIRVLKGGGLHPEAVAPLREARRLADKAVRSVFFFRKHTKEAIREQKKARALLVE
jgi:copper homeostasis protein CutC